MARLCLLIPIILLLFTRKRHRGKGLWVIYIYFFVDLITELINTYYNHRFNENFYLNWNLFNIIEYYLLALFIRNLLRTKTLKIIILVFSLLFLVVAFASVISGGYSKHYDSITNGLESILLIIYSIFYLFEQISKPDHIFFYSIPEFWIIVAILLYFSGTFFFNTYANGLIESNKSFQAQYSAINNAFEILKSLLFGVAMVVKGDAPINNASRIDYSNLDEHLNLNR